MSKKIEPTVAMILEAASTGTPLGTDARAILRAALNHPDAPGLFADEDDRPWEPLNEWDPVRVGDEVRQELNGVTTIAVVGRVDGEGDPWTAEDRFIGVHDEGTWRVRRAVQQLPTEDGAVIVPAEGREFIEAVVNGHTYYAREAMLINGLWRAVWRTPHCFQVSYSVLPWKITPGIWKVDDE